MLSEKESKRHVGEKQIVFYFKDKNNTTLFRTFGGGIKAFASCIKFIDELGNYDSLSEMTLTQKLNKLQEEKESLVKVVAELEAKNESLQAKLDSIIESRSDLRKLTQLLYEN